MSNVSVNLPITFTTNYQITAMHRDSGDGSTWASYYIPGSSLSSVHFGGGRTNIGVMYIAIGY